jgi:hypothetical protein
LVPLSALVLDEAELGIDVHVEHGLGSLKNVRQTVAPLVARGV